MLSTVDRQSPANRATRLHATALTRLVAAGAAGLLVLAVALNVVAATPTLTVPGHALPGTQITVSGAGFSAGQTGNLTLNGAKVRSFSASSSGAFSVPFTIPTTAQLGTVARISAKDGSGNVLATSTIAIATAVSAPTLYVPKYANAGTSILVGGAGFSAGRTGNLTIDGLVVRTFTAGSNGTFQAKFVIPTSTPEGTARISAQTSSGTVIATTTLGIGTGTTTSPSPTPAPVGTAAATASPTVAPPAPTTTPGPSVAPTATPNPSATATAPMVSGPPNWAHVYVIYFENKEYSSIVGSSSAPYINSLIAKYGLATNFYAERHPSEPNYIALTSGGTQGITDDGTYNLSVDNLYKQVEASGRTWHEWEQGWPGNCFTGTSSSAVVDGPGYSGSYVRKHNPAISYTSISANSTECSHITNLASFNPALASFNFITPNMINDMHDGTIAQGDTFLKAFLPEILNSSAFTNSVVFVTFDEGTTNLNGGGHIVTVAIQSGMTPGFRQAATYNHYSMLRTIEQAWHLPYLGSASSAATMSFPW